MIISIVKIDMLSLNSVQLNLPICKTKPSKFLRVGLLFVFLFFGTGSHCIALAGLEFTENCLPLLYSAGVKIVSYHTHTEFLYFCKSNII